MSHNHLFLDIQADFANNAQINPDRIDELHRYLTRITKHYRNDISHDDCQEVVQLALIKLWDMSKKYEIKTNIRTAARWVIRGVLRLKEFMPPSKITMKSIDNIQEGSIQGSVGDDHQSQEQRLEKDRRTALLLKAKSEVLNDIERELFFRHYDQGEQIKDIAEEWGIEANTVTQRHRRAVQKVTKYIQMHHAVDE